MKHSTVGLVQMFELAPSPQVLARAMLDQILGEWRVSARRYMLHLELSRCHARRYGTTLEVEGLDVEIAKHRSNDGLPRIWRVDHIFSAAGYAEYGRKVFNFWGLVLFHFCVQTRQWDEKLAAFSVKDPAVRDPYRLPGFEPMNRVWSTGWLEEFRRAWQTELRDVYPQLGHYLS